MSDLFVRFGHAPGAFIPLAGVSNVEQPSEPVRQSGDDPPQAINQP